MQRKILQSKNKITLVSGILIVIGFIAHLGFNKVKYYEVLIAHHNMAFPETFWI